MNRSFGPWFAVTLFLSGCGQSGSPFSGNGFSYEASPANGGEVNYSVPVQLTTDDPTVGRIEVTAEGGAACTSAGPYFECLLDVTGEASGELTILVTVVSKDGATLAQLPRRVVHRSQSVPCSGSATALNACILDRVGGGISAGYTGVSYLNADNDHALFNTTGMTGISVQHLSGVPTTIPGGVEMGVTNESRVWAPSGGTCSKPRCWTNTDLASAARLYESGMLALWPEHRDHGYRDHYQWQTPVFAMSQGSSGSELDEVGNLLRALAILEPTARATAKQSSALGATMSFLLGRSRVASDAEYISSLGHPTAYQNTSNSERILSLAASLRSGEIPPVAKIGIVEAKFPDGWNMTPALNSSYAMGYTPYTTPASVPGGEFEIHVTLSDSFDPNQRALTFFPVVLQASGSEVTVERSGSFDYVIRGKYPVDTLVSVAGKDRTLSRATIAFFPHNGIWLGAPTMLSVGGRQSDETALDGNNLD